MQAEASFAGAECIYDYEFDDSLASSPISGEVEPLFNMIGSVLFDSVSLYAQFVRAIEIPPEIA